MTAQDDAAELIKSSISLAAAASQSSALYKHYEKIIKRPLWREKRLLQPDLRSSRIIKQRTCARCGEKKYSNETRVRDKEPQRATADFCEWCFCSPLIFCILITRTARWEHIPKCKTRLIFLWLIKFIFVPQCSAHAKRCYYFNFITLRAPRVYLTFAYTWRRLSTERLKSLRLIAALIRSFLCSLAVTNTLI